MQNGMLGVCVCAPESIQFRILHTAFSQIIASIPLLDQSGAVMKFAGGVV